MNEIEDEGGCQIYGGHVSRSVFQSAFLAKSGLRKFHEGPRQQAHLEVQQLVVTSSNSTTATLDTVASALPLCIAIHIVIQRCRCSDPRSWTSAASSTSRSSATTPRERSSQNMNQKGTASYDLALPSSARFADSRALPDSAEFLIAR